MPVNGNGGRSPLWRWAAVAAALVLAGCGEASSSLQESDPMENGRVQSTPTAAPAAPSTQQSQSEPAPEDLPDPVEVAVPALGIEASLVPLAVDAENVLVPPDHGRAGWWEAGPEPGEPGSAVIAGHLDNVDGPDVFYRLADAEPGDLIAVSLADGRRLDFSVVDVAQFPQAEFPTERVYGGEGDRPLLRLITCGGEYDRDAGRYRDNVVVFAEPA